MQSCFMETSVLLTFKVCCGANIRVSEREVFWVVPEDVEDDVQHC